jgi:oligoendopeptidase F
LRRYEEIQEVLGRAAAFAFLDFSTDVADPARGALLQKVQETGTQIGTHLIFFQLEWIAVADEQAEVLVEDAALQNYRHYLKAARRYKPYVLSEPEERILVEKSVTARSNWDRLFEEASTAIRVRIDDNEVSLDEALAQLQDGDQSRRKVVSEAVTEALGADLRTRRFIFNTILADKSIDDRLRSFPHWLAERNLANEAADESVQALIEAVTSRYDITHRFYALKKRLMGVENFYDYDRYAPLDADEPDVSWPDAKEIVLDAYGQFSPRLRELAEEFFEKSWIDAALASHKRGGAYAHQTIPSLHPYVLLNYTGKRRDVLTLAHELGHGVHMSLSRRQSVLNFETPLTTAETASIFGETVTFARLLQQEDDPQRRLHLLVGRIDDAIASIFRQVAMNRFEDASHNARRAQGELSGDAINQMWLDSQRAMLGPAVEVTDNYATWWSYIPHFIGVPGYVYAYAFGNLLALAIYQRAVEEGPSFAPKYFDMLAAGGSESPEEVTARVGVDLTDPGFWAGGLDMISKLVDDAEALSRETSAT